MTDRKITVTTLDEAYRAVCKGWELIPELSAYCVEYKKKPNKYQKRYARIGRRMKNRR